LAFLSTRLHAAQHRIHILTSHIHDSSRVLAQEKQIDFQFSMTQAAKRQSPLFHEVLLSASRTTCAAAEVNTPAWRKHSPHVPRNHCARACHPSLYCSLRHTQRLGCLKDRKTVDDA
jgi:hypothetical protein